MPDEPHADARRTTGEADADELREVNRQLRIALAEAIDYMAGADRDGELGISPDHPRWEAVLRRGGEIELGDIVRFRSSLGEWVVVKVLENPPGFEIRRGKTIFEVTAAEVSFIRSHD